MSYVIALTGGIGSGKTTVSNLFLAEGIPVFDSDEIARDLVRSGSDLLRKISDHFGPSILDENKELNRRKLRDIIFQSPEQKNWLEKLLHPEIRKKLKDSVENCHSPYCLLAIPLLFETGMESLADRILVVDLEESLQLNRAQLRDQQSFEQIQKIQATQFERKERLKKADDVIDNNGNLEDLLPQVTKLHALYLRLASLKTLSEK